MVSADARKNILESIESAADAALNCGFDDLHQKLRMILRTEESKVEFQSDCVVTILHPVDD